MTEPTPDFRPSHVGETDIFYVVEGNPTLGETPFQRFPGDVMQINHNADTINIWYRSPINYGIMTDDQGNQTGYFVSPGILAAKNVPHGDGTQGHTYIRGWELAP